jgi:hypothetical protein
LADVPPIQPPKPIKPLKKVTAKMIVQGIREGRESCGAFA